jgi:hypothetical protein
MKKYFLHNGTEQQGPFDTLDLKAKAIKQETPIWYEGLSEWTTAGKVDELKELFSQSTPPPFEKKTAPPLNKPQTSQTTSIKKKNTLGVILTSIGVIGAIILIVIFASNSSNGGGGGAATTDETTYRQKVMTVEEIERSQPTKFLTATGTYRQNFWGDKFKVDCEITNKATVAAFKDAVVEVTYYSKTKTVLGSNKYTIYESFPPHSTKTVKLKIDNYKDVNSIGWDVISALPN